MTKKIKILLIIGAIIVFIIAVLAWIVFPIDIYKLNGDSMSPTYSNGDQLTVNKYAPLTRGSIIIFNSTIPDKNQLLINVKRIIGLPNELLTISNCKVSINNQELNLKELMPNTTACISGEINLKIPENEYFVIGDNPAQSLDSRILGAIKKADIIGVVHGKLK